MSKKSEIKVKVELDENHVPENLSWEAEDGDQKGDCGAVMMAMWERATKNVLRIDLWDKEMTTDEMKMMIHQSIITMADSFERATNEEKMANEMRDFGHYFASEMKLVD